MCSAYRAFQLMCRIPEISLGYQLLQGLFTSNATGLNSGGTGA